jgi:hypothetical protein
MHDASFVKRECNPSRICWGGKAIQTSEVDLPESFFVPYHVDAQVRAPANVTHI